MSLNSRIESNKEKEEECWRSQLKPEVLLRVGLSVVTFISLERPIRDTYLESYITKYTSTRREQAPHHEKYTHQVAGPGGGIDSRRDIRDAVPEASSINNQTLLTSRIISSAFQKSDAFKKRSIIFKCYSSFENSFPSQVLASSGGIDSRRDIRDAGPDAAWLPASLFLSADLSLTADLCMVVIKVYLSLKCYSSSKKTIVGRRLL